MSPAPSLWRKAAWILPYLRPHRKALIFSLCLSVLSTALGMVQPFFAKILIDRVLVEKQPDLLAPLLAVMIGLLLAGFLLRTGNSYLYTLYSARLLFKMREDLFAHVHGIPLKLLARRKIGDVYSRIASDMAEIQGLATETLPHYFFNALTCLITVGILLYLDAVMALMSFVFLPAALYLISKIRPRLLDLARRVTEANADIAHFLFESLSSTPLVRAFGAREAETEKFREKQSRILGFLLRHQILGACSASVPTTFIVVNTLVVFGYGGPLVMEGSLSLGSLVAFSIYQGRLLGPLQGLMDGFLALQKAVVALDRVGEIRDIPPDVLDDGALTLAPGELRGELAVDKVSFAYDPAEPVLREVSFTVPAGSVTALVGPSGSGKSTLCHLLLRLFDPDEGRITLDGRDLREFRLDWLRKRMALVSQETLLFHASLLDNIRFARPDASLEAVREAARAACIDEFIESLPEGYHTVAGDRGVRLSGGQKQRMGIARSVLLDPEILILDEATAFLDGSAEDRLKETLARLMKDRTLLVVSHRFSTIQWADRVVTLASDGRIVSAPGEESGDSGSAVAGIVK